MIQANSIRQFASLLVVSIFGAQSQAETLTLQPTAIGTVGIGFHRIWIARGTFLGYDRVTPPVGHSLGNFFHIFVEFDLATLPAGKKIQSAQLKLEGRAGDVSATLFGYTGDGLVTVADIQNAPLSQIANNLHAGKGSWKSSATKVVTSTATKGNRFVGFRVSPDTFNPGLAGFSSTPTLTITFK